MTHSIIGVYESYSQARDAMNELIASGFDPNKLHINPDREPAAQATHASTQQNEHASGIGHFFRSLFGMEDHNEREQVYSEAVRRGNCLLRFDADTEEECNRATEVMQRYDPVDIDERSTYWKSEGWTGFDASAPKMTEEEIQLDRSRYSTNRSTATAAATTPHMSRRLHVYSGGRRLFDQPAMNPDAAMAAEATGRPEIRDAAEHTHPADARLRQEGDSVIDKSHAAAIDAGSPDAPSAVMEDDTDFRRHWQQAYGQSGERYEEYDAAYRYGSSLSDSDHFKSGDWTNAEPGIRRDWEMRHPESTWDKVRDAVRYGAQRTRSKM